MAIKEAEIEEVLGVEFYMEFRKGNLKELGIRHVDYTNGFCGSSTFHLYFSEQHSGVMIDEIQDDLTSQGFSVEKVAQLTRSKTKAPLPIFMVELEKKSDSPDIFKVKKCCYLAVQIDAFNRRPGVSQCYNCNLFNHSSKNCFMRTRCLKCGESHRTNECPIKEKIENPLCASVATRRDTWQIRANVRNSPKENPEKVKRFAVVTPLPNLTKPQKRSPQISPSQLPSRTLRNKIILPELRPPLKKPLQSMKKVMIKTLASKTRYANSEDFF
ncbi:uncharacterized protein TNCV_1267811 [Trichonephila clavipes]|nr:uncharacterized protein TNCV_1267811 [Trichonephila clavipes]